MKRYLVVGAAVAAMAVATLIPLRGVSASSPVLASPHKVSFSGDLPDGTETYQSFHCDSGEALITAAAHMQIGSSYAVPLGLEDFTASTYPEGVVVAMVNHSGIDQDYYVVLICAAVVDI